MGDEQERARVLVAQVALEPLDRLDVEVVRRLVEDRERGPRHEDARERGAAPLAAGERARWAASGRSTPDVAEDGLDLVHHVPAAEPLDVGRGLRPARRGARPGRRARARARGSPARAAPWRRTRRRARLDDERAA